MAAEPFYYYETADGKLLYGTTIRKIMEQPGFVKELNEEMLQLYLSLTYVAGENTFFRGLKKLLFRAGILYGRTESLR